MKKRILITGSAGFVAHHACEHFLTNTNWEVVGIDSLRHKGCPLRLKHIMGNPRFSHVTHDLTTEITPRLIDAIGPVDYILNCASESHVDRSITDPAPFWENNVKLIIHVAEYARKVKPKAFIQCSTDEVFGPAIGFEKHKEWLPHKPSNPYAASKAAQDSLLFSYWRCYGLPLIKTHCMNMIGERQDAEKFLPMCMTRIARGETMIIHGKPGDIGSRMYLHSRNLADAWLFLLQNTRPMMYVDDHSFHQFPDTYNIVGDEEVDNLDLASAIANIMGKKLNYEFLDFHSARPGHDRRYALDGSKIAERGWKAPVPLWESIKKTVEWTMKEENKIWMK